MTIFYSILIILLSTGFLLLPTASLSCAREGLIYFGLNMIPALFPFMVLTNLALELNLTRRIAPIIHPVTHLLFRSDYEEDFCILTGLLCGFPVGAITLSSQIRSGRVSLSRGRRLLSFICLPGPIYIASLILPMLPTSTGKILFLALYYGIALCMGIFLCAISDKKESNRKDYRMTSEPVASFPDAFQKALNVSLRTIFTLGGIVIMFYTLRLFLSFLPKNAYPISIITSFLLEINGGTATLMNYRNSLSERGLLLHLSLFPLCGLSCLMQVLTVIKDSGLRLRDYLIPRLVHFLAYLGIALCIILIFPNLI